MDRIVVGAAETLFLFFLTGLDAGQVGLPEPEDAAAAAARLEILEILYSPEDAFVASRMPIRPSPCPR